MGPRRLPSLLGGTGSHRSGGVRDGLDALPGGDDLLCPYSVLYMTSRQARRITSRSLVTHRRSCCRESGYYRGIALTN
jgi:hypothetical protein